MNKQDALDAITKEIEECETCKIGKVGVAVSGEGNPDADVVFIGEAPGQHEAKTGRPCSPRCAGREDSSENRARKCD